jgi:hypothetical protein
MMSMGAADAELDADLGFGDVELAQQGSAPLCAPNPPQCCVYSISL